MSKEFSQNIEVGEDNKKDFTELPKIREDISFIVENYSNRFSGLLED